MKYKRLEDVLENGTYKLRVYKAEVWDDEKKSFIPGTQKSGTSVNGNKYWMYNVDLCDDKPLRYTDDNGKERRITVLAFDDRQKEILDSGEVEVVIKNKIDKTTQQIEAFIDSETGEPSIRKVVFFNKIGTANDIEETKKATEETRTKLYDDEIDNTDIPL